MAAFHIRCFACSKASYYWYIRPTFYTPPSSFQGMMLKVHSYSFLCSTGLQHEGPFQSWPREIQSQYSWILGRAGLTGAECPHKQVRERLGDKGLLLGRIRLPPGHAELCHALLQLRPLRSRLRIQGSCMANLYITVARGNRQGLFSQCKAAWCIM